MKGGQYEKDGGRGGTKKMTNDDIGGGGLAQLNGDFHRKLGVRGPGYGSAKFINQGRKFICRRIKNQRN